MMKLAGSVHSCTHESAKDENVPRQKPFPDILSNASQTIFSGLLIVAHPVVFFV